MRNRPKYTLYEKGTIVRCLQNMYFPDFQGQGIVIG